MISLVYKNENILSEIKKEFIKNDIIKLESFFLKSFYDVLKEESENLKFKHKKIPDRFSYSESEKKDKIKSLLDTKDFQNFIHFITGKKISSFSVRKFSHRDYTILHDEESKIQKTKLLIFICEKWEPDLGGNFVFTKSDGKTFYITPMENSLAIINEQKDWREFVQYVNHLSNQREIIVIDCPLK